MLRGEVSIVGPRPERPEFIAELQEQVPFYRTRLLVKPGLTGWAQIHYGYGNSVRDALVKLQYDLYYIHHWSLWMDLRDPQDHWRGAAVRGDVMEGGRGRGEEEPRGQGEGERGGGLV